MACRNQVIITQPGHKYIYVWVWGGGRGVLNAFLSSITKTQRCIIDTDLPVSVSCNGVLMIGELQLLCVFLCWHCSCSLITCDCWVQMLFWNFSRTLLHLVADGCSSVDTVIPLLRACSTWDFLLHLYFVTCLLLEWLKLFQCKTWWKLWQPRESQEQKGKRQLCQGVLVWCHIFFAKFYFVLIPCTAGNKGTSNRSKLFVIPPKFSPCLFHNGFAGPSPSVSF